MFRQGSQLVARRLAAPQHRTNYQAFMRQKLDKRTGQYKCEDWDDIMHEFTEPTLLSGETLLERDEWNTRHIKPKERKRQINAGKIYRRKVKQLDDLMAYIKFMKEYDK